MKIYHNPRCRKSRETLKIIEDQGKEFEIIEYLTNPPTPAELKHLLSLLGMKPLDLIRKGEDVFKQNYKGKDLSDDEWIEAMIENPKLIERPIVIAGNRAVLSRPPENVMQLL